jgi:hypothetical protein
MIPDAHLADALARSRGPTMAVYDDVWPLRDFLGAGITRTNGEFTVTYDSSAYGPGSSNVWPRTSPPSTRTLRA